MMQEIYHASRNMIIGTVAHLWYVLDKPEEKL